PLDELEADRLVVERCEAGRTEVALDYRVGQRAHVTGLLPAEADRPQPRVVELQHPGGARRSDERLEPVVAARAEARETCCSRMICTRVPKPGSRAHSG